MTPSTGLENISCQSPMAPSAHIHNRLPHASQRAHCAARNQLALCLSCSTAVGSLPQAPAAHCPRAIRAVSPPPSIIEAQLRSRRYPQESHRSNCTASQHGLTRRSFDDRSKVGRENEYLRFVK